MLKHPHNLLTCSYQTYKILATRRYVGYRHRREAGPQKVRGSAAMNGNLAELTPLLNDIRGLAVSDV